MSLGAVIDELEPDFADVGRQTLVDVAEQSFLVKLDRFLAQPKLILALSDELDDVCFLVIDLDQALPSRITLIGLFLSLIAFGEAG